MQRMTLIDAGQFVCFLAATGEAGRMEAQALVARTPRLALCRIVEVNQYAPDRITPGLVYDRETGLPAGEIDESPLSTTP